MHAFVPPSLRHFEPLRVIPGPAARHIPLLYDLAEALRPSLVADVATGAATAFFTVCQSLRDHDIDASAYAVDAWPEGAPATHPEATYDAIGAHGRKHYPGIHYLLRDDPRSSHRHFAEASVDLLHVDVGCFVGADSDLDAWLARVRPGGVVALHDVLAEGRPLWDAATRRGPSALFSSGRGLGLVRVGAPSNAGSELLSLLFDASDLAGLSAFYEHAWEHHQLRRLVQKLG